MKASEKKNNSDSYFSTEKKALRSSGLKSSSGLSSSEGVKSLKNKRDIELDQIEREIQLNKKYFEKVEKGADERRMNEERDIDQEVDRALGKKRIDDRNRKDLSERREADEEEEEEEEELERIRENDSFNEEKKYLNKPEENNSYLAEKIKKMKQELRLGHQERDLRAKYDNYTVDKPKDVGVKREILASGSKGFGNPSNSKRNNEKGLDDSKLKEKDDSALLHRKYGDTERFKADSTSTGGETDYRRYLREKLEKEEKERESLAKDRVIKDLR